MPSLRTLLSSLINSRKSSKGQKSKQPSTPVLPAPPTRKQRRRAKAFRQRPSPPRAPSPYPTLNTTSRDQPSEPTKTHLSPSGTWSSYKKAQEVAMRDEEERERMEQESQTSDSNGSEKGSAAGTRESREFRMWLKKTVDFDNFTAGTLN
ncbi:hypothetical protein IWX90DRAFT_415623 [Phyllosticta citrichinensis]|uniref:Uncharacterized protein n=1 Tax=Phyllosticta citrichinensis TaxID=1130410 RepID=A0ABR1XQ23_9PEZI